MNMWPQVKDGCEEKEPAFFLLPIALSGVIEVTVMAMVMYCHVQTMIPAFSYTSPCSFHAHSTGHITRLPPVADTSGPPAADPQGQDSGPGSGSHLCSKTSRDPEQASKSAS